MSSNCEGWFEREKHTDLRRHERVDGGICSFLHKPVILQPLGDVAQLIHVSTTLRRDVYRPRSRRTFAEIAVLRSPRCCSTDPNAISSHHNQLTDYTPCINSPVVWLSVPPECNALI